MNEPADKNPQTAASEEKRREAGKDTPQGNFQERRAAADPPARAQRVLTSPGLLLTDCDVNARYHAARVAFFDSLHRWIMVAVVISGAQALVRWLPDAFYPALYAAPAVLGLIDIVLDLAGRARRHEILFRRFAELHGRIASAMDAPEAEQRRWNREIWDIYRDEPPVLHALHDLCHNEVMTLLGERGQRRIVPVSLRRRWFAHWWRFQAIKR